jgi:hypothetical protein
MTYDIKLDLVFNTLDRSALRQAIKDNYLERKGVTTLIDSINRSSIVIFDGIKKEWRDGDDVIDTMRRSTLLPFAVGKACHYIALNGCCGDQYEALFNYKIIKLANAYILTMLPIVKQQKIDKLEEDLIPLEKQQNSALDAIKEASQGVFDLKLEELKKKVLDKNQQIKELNSAILGLTAFQSEITQAEDNASNLWGLLNKNYEDKRAEWIPIVTQQNIYTNELKNAADLGQTLVVANARLQNFTSEKTKLDQDIADLENQNKVAHEARLLTAYKKLADITTQMTDIRNELSILKK